MISLIAKALGWIARRLGLLLIIVGVLVAVAWLKSERDSLERDRQAIADQQTLLESMQAELKIASGQKRSGQTLLDSSAKSI